MVIFNAVNLIVKAKGRLHLNLVFRLVLPVPAPREAFEILHRSQVLSLPQLIYIVNNAVLIPEPLGGPALFVNEFENQPGIDHSLPFQDIPETLEGYPDIGEDLPVRLPFLYGAGMLITALLFFQTSYIVALFKVQLVFVTVAKYCYIHVFRAVLGSAGSEAVKPQRELVVLARVVHVFPPGIEFAVYQFPVISLFIGVEIQGDPPALILHGYGVIRVPCDPDQAPETLPGFIDGVGQYLKE